MIAMDTFDSSFYFCFSVKCLLKAKGNNRLRKSVYLLPDVNRKAKKVPIVLIKARNGGGARRQYTQSGQSRDRPSGEQFSL